jgi:hypothetical protein
MARRLLEARRPFIASGSFRRQAAVLSGYFCDGGCGADAASAARRNSVW